MELNETVELMNSENYKDRFIAEYVQVSVRYKKLKDMLQKWDSNELDFYPVCPRSTYEFQLKTMFDYISILEARAYMEDIDLVK